MHPRFASLLWAVTAWINIGTGIVAYVIAGYPPEWSLQKAAHVLWLILGLGHWVKGMVAFSHLLTGRRIDELNALFLRVDDRPLLKCGLGLLAFAILMLYCITSVLGGYPWYWWTRGAT